MTQINSPFSYYASKMFEIYQTKKWGNGSEEQPLSGPGSALCSTSGIRGFLGTAADRYNIRSALDVGCGDLNWIQKCETVASNEFSRRRIAYYGVDVVSNLIEKHQQSHPWGNFYCCDITIGLPQNEACKNVDLVILRDIIMHLSFADILRAFSNLLSDCHFKYILLTSHNTGIANSDLLNEFHFHHIDLTQEPFNFNVRKAIEEIDESHSCRRMLLFPRQAFAEFVEKCLMNDGAEPFHTKQISMETPQLLL